MRIISFRKIREFFDTDPGATIPLKLWYKKVQKADWDNFSDIKNTFNSVDFIGNQRCVFNIAGNRYRLIAKVLFETKIVYIRFVGSHRDYDKTKEIKNI